jgi:DNA methylase
MGITEKFLEAIHSQEPVDGYTHEFYRYPARFSPLFAREAIRAFSEPGDTVLDPFMGGGTTLVEALISGRRAVGVDISTLAVFIAGVKTTPLSKADISAVRSWTESLDHALSLRNPPIRDDEWVESGYQRNISDRLTWPIRKTLELALAEVNLLANERQRRFARCVLLRTAQWALDCRIEFPSAREVRQKFKVLVEEMLTGAKEYANAVAVYGTKNVEVACLNRSIVGLETDKVWKTMPSPKLVITSPPYPGVHVLYHRWQIQGRRETPAAFWIAGSLDGHGASFYTFGDRKQQNLSNYYTQAKAGFRSVAKIADCNTTIVQMVAFSDPSWQLPKYLTVMRDAGFREVKHQARSNAKDGRLWRSVPNRKWYATQKGAIGASNEVVLFHKLK